MNVSRREFIGHTLRWGGVLFVGGALFETSARAPTDMPPAYGHLFETGALKTRVEQAYAHFENCSLCPRLCGADRLSGDTGLCRATATLKVSSAHPHFGEEHSLTGQQGSGTIFFSNCNLRCVFCQNWPIAIEGHGTEIEDKTLSEMMLRLQDVGCHNINLVTPTHVMPNILNALYLAYQKGLRLPLVYNTSGYERLEILRLLDGIVDIYLPDMKYWDPQKAAAYSTGATDYPETARQALLEMHRQVGLHQTDAHGIAQRGLMIRHLVMPNRVAGTKEFIRWAATHLPTKTYINIMSQYHVAHQAYNYPEIWRGITVAEYLEAMTWAEQYGLSNLDPDSLKTLAFYRRQ